jgi:hypothetical protein
MKKLKYLKYNNMDILNITPIVKNNFLFVPSCLLINMAIQKSKITAAERTKTNLGAPQAKKKKLAKKVTRFLNRDGIRK